MGPRRRGPAWTTLVEYVFLCVQIIAKQGFKSPINFVCNASLKHCNSSLGLTDCPCTSVVVGARNAVCSDCWMGCRVVRVVKAALHQFLVPPYQSWSFLRPLDWTGILTPMISMLTSLLYPIRDADLSVLATQRCCPLYQSWPFQTLIRFT